ncbi:MAG TPA: amino acid adenylation domain-containing protein, partial [Kofleriaceae bacterium]|nr:amino acid adenylation domain-containing protein [Kofleriaceae bacterium]
APVRALAALSDDTYKMVVEDWNATARDHQLDVGFAARFAARATATPDAIAAREPGRSITYRALAAKAHRVGHALRAHGVQIGDRIAVLADRGLDQLALITGVLAAGAVYVALDVRHPDDRIAQIIAASDAMLVLTTRDAHPAITTASLSARAIFAGDLPDHALDLPTHPDQLAYVIFTSGSTGTPKGAMVSLAGMLNNQLSKLPFFQLSERDVIAQTAAPSFDISVWQLLTGLLCGAVIDFVPDDTVADPRALARHLRASGVTIAELVPALIQELLREPELDLPALRFLLPTGEALPPELARAWLRRFPHIPLVNAYGPAECADDVALAPITTPPAADVLRMPIGRPTDNTRLFVVDPSLSPVPVGVAGQLAVAGVGVGHGYLADPSRTAAVFIPNPFGAPGERMYLTGDLARFQPDGTLEYVGRLDHQVKLRGHRIELGEIEARLVEQPGVDLAAVLLRDDVPGQPRLVAYFAGTASVDDLRARLTAALPAAMVPSVLVPLAALPLSHNGKIDRRALPAPDLDTTRAYVAPRTPLEAQLAHIWADVLAVDRVGLHDNFFALGGHSLLATRVTARVLAAHGRELPLRTIFEAPTLAAFAARVADSSTITAPIPPADRTQPLALSFAQERQWFLWRLEPESTAYHIPLVAELTGALDLAALRAAFAQLIVRHEALRTRFVATADGVHQVVERDLPIAIPHTSATEAALEAAIADAIAAPFDLTTGPLWRAAVHELAADRHVLVVVVHHIVADDV